MLFLQDFVLVSCIHILFYTGKLLIDSNKSGDYEILKKGAERADGINDVEEFNITEVSV